MSFSSKSTASSSSSSSSCRGNELLAEDLVGQYECTEYIGTSEENPWHRVAIRHVGKQTFAWKNEAGVEWTLSKDLNNDSTTLAVGTECPYYKDGHKFCRVERSEEDGRVVALLGPHDERYERKLRKPASTTKGLRAVIPVPTIQQLRERKIHADKQREEKHKLKQAVLREKAEKLRMKNKLLRKQQRATGDRLEEAKTMSAFTEELATVAKNIQSIAALKECLPQHKAGEVDLLTLQLFEDLQSLAQRASPAKAATNKVQEKPEAEPSEESYDIVEDFGEML